MKSLFAAALLIATLPAAATSGTEFLYSCDSNVQTLVAPDNRANLNLCFGLLEGAIGAHRQIAQFTKQAALFCLPEEVSIEQTRLVTVGYMKKHPELLHAGASGLILAALHDAFPCEQGK